MMTTVPTAGDEERLVAERLREAAREIRNDGTPSQVGLTDEECEQVADIITRLRQERDEAREHAELLADKINGPATCACAYDYPDDLCAHHSPKLAAAEAALTASNAEAERLRARQKAIETLLYTDECFYGTDWHGKHYTDATADPTPVLCVNFINYGADAEPIPEEWIIPLAALVEKHGGMAVHAWVCAVRGLDDLPKGKLNADCRAVLDEVRAALQGSAKQ